MAVSSLSAVIQAKITGTYTPATTAPAINTSTGTPIPYLFDVGETLTNGGAVPATTVVKFRKLLTTGAATVDLTSLTDLLQNILSLSGLKVQAILIQALSTNANDISFTFGASNPYNLAGSDFKWTLKASQYLLFGAKEQAPDVGSGAKNIDFAGTGTQGVDIMIIAG